jgi:hypothetical protein
MADDDRSSANGDEPSVPSGSAAVLDVLREAGYEVTDEALAEARARLDRALVTEESRAESRERVREIMGWS